MKSSQFLLFAEVCQKVSWRIHTVRIIKSTACGKLRKSFNDKADEVFRGGQGQIN
jgi:hypothetical protein